MPIAELFLSPLVSLLCEKLVSGVLLHFARQEGIHSLLKKWSKTLLIIQSVIHDAEDKQITDGGIKAWLESLRDVAYDLDDILDEIITEALQQNLMQHEPRRSKVCKLFLACYNLRPRPIRFNSRMMSKIKNVTASLDEIAKQKNDFNLIEGVRGMSNRIETVSYTHLEILNKYVLWLSACSVPSPNLFVLLD